MPRILIIDDEPLVRAFLAQSLKGQGYELVEAVNGQEALERFEERPADLVITDIVMPEKEGLETLIALRRKVPDLPVIAMSGGGRIEGRHYLRLARQLGADLVLEKPFYAKVIVLAVRDLLERRAGASSVANDNRRFGAAVLDLKRNVE